jgi:hypothetical protein
MVSQAPNNRARGRFHAAGSSLRYIKQAAACAASSLPAGLGGQEPPSHHWNVSTFTLDCTPRQHDAAVGPSVLG